MTRSEESAFKLHSAEFREKASNLGQDVKKLGDITKTLAKDAVNALGDNASNYYEQSIEKAKLMEKKWEGKIREKPVQSLLIAAGIGLVLGVLWRRR